MRLLVSFYLRLLGVMLVAKLLFLAWNSAAQGGVSAGEVMQVLWYGLPLDLATAGYLSAPLLLGLLCEALGLRLPRRRLIYRAYAAVLSAVLAVIFVSDTGLYAFWSFKLDGTALSYLDSPRGVLASVSAGYAVGAVLAILSLALAQYWALSRVGRCAPQYNHLSLSRRAARVGILVLCGGLLFLAIRGGVGKSTANVGMVYFSSRQYLNHSAVNPAFSLFYSLRKAQRFGQECNYYDEAQRSRLFATTSYAQAAFDPREALTDTLFTTQRPNVVLILMEGCSAAFVNAFNPAVSDTITPNLNRLAREGVAFTQCYANSFRTDRGTLSTLSGYPAFPDLSVMKLAAKCAALQSIAGALRGAGYDTEFLYGGDINFTGTNGYLLATGYARTYGDKAFPASVRKTHDWGVTDRIVLDSLYAHCARQPRQRPWHIACLTLASHEPWGVPYARIASDPVANTMAYLDDCIGRFTARLRTSPLWENTLVILLPDHGINYPAGIASGNPERAHIPLIIAGGAVRAPRRIDVLCNQSDLAATLLSQLGIPHRAFRFSRNVLSPRYTHPSAVHAWPEGIWWKEPGGTVTISTVGGGQGSLLREEGSEAQQRAQRARAYLQTIYDDLDALGHRAP